MFCFKSRDLLLRQIWIVKYYIICSSDNLSNENKKTGVSREMIFSLCLETLLRKNTNRKTSIVDVTLFDRVEGLDKGT